MLETTDDADDIPAMDEDEAGTEEVREPVMRQEQADEIREGKPWH